MNKKRYIAPHILVYGLTSMNSVMEPEIGIGSTTGEALSKQGSWFDEDENTDDDFLGGDLWDDEREAASCW